MERVCAKGKRENEMWKKRRKERRENEGEGEREERRGRERRIENRESGETREKHNSHKKRFNKTEPESSGGSPAKTIKLRRFISRRSQLRTRRGRISEV